MAEQLGPAHFGAESDDAPASARAASKVEGKAIVNSARARRCLVNGVVFNRDFNLSPDEVEASMVVAPRRKQVMTRPAMVGDAMRWEDVEESNRLPPRVAQAFNFFDVLPAGRLKRLWHLPTRMPLPP